MRNYAGYWVGCNIDASGRRGAERRGRTTKKKSMKLTLGFSPCPNDTFIFDALVNKKIDTGGLDFDVIMDDVQTLNEMAIEGKLDVTKISYGSLPLISTNTSCCLLVRR